ncbi:sensor protein resE [Lachnospiraceae bacterium KM106-2]|nr:sensor protein resE [Lachnospiraceae bacterium KM106-2]
MIFFRKKKQLRKLNKMIDAAIDGSFKPEDYVVEEYTEEELSKLEEKWRRYLTTSKMASDSIKKEREEIKSLVSDISHQAKTPLSNILLYSEILEQRDLDEETLHYITYIHKQSEKLNFLIQSLVKISRLEAGTMKIIPKQQSVIDIIDRVKEEITLKAKKKNITITFPDNIKEQARYDLKWTQEAVFNLLDNAVKYSYEGGKIEVFIQSYEMFVAIGVKDYGIGIKEDELNAIFLRFYRSEKVQEQDGIGLGLYLARKIIMMQQGYIKVESKEGEGTTFEVFLQR